MVIVVVTGNWLINESLERFKIHFKEFLFQVLWWTIGKLSSSNAWWNKELDRLLQGGREVVGQEKKCEF